MIQTEIFHENFIRAWSDAGFFIHGGEPEGDYAEAIDPIGTGRTYTETDRKIEPETEDTEAETEDYVSALARLGVE